MLCESRCVQIFIYNANIRYLPLSEMGHMAALRISLLKSLFEIKLNQMTINSLSFPFDRLDEDNLSLQSLRKLPDDFWAKNHRALWYSWFFRQKLAFGFLRELLYGNETLEHWPRGTFAALTTRE